MQLNLQKNVLYFSKNSWASTNAKLSMTFICKLFQSWLHVGPFMLYEVSPILVMSRRLRCFWKALVFLYAFEESVDCHLLSSFCDDSNLHISLFNWRAVWSCAAKKQRDNRWPFGEFPIGESCLSLLELKRRNQKRRLPGAHCTVVKLFGQLRLRYICNEHLNSRISLWGVNIDALGG